jgi:hypothetical protein
MNVELNILSESKLYFRIAMLFKCASCDFAFFTGLDIHLVQDTNVFL